MPFLFLFLCLFLFFPSSNGRHIPFDSSECTACIEKFNYLHMHNKTLINTVKNINSFCDSYNISICRNITDYGIQFLEQNPEDICGELGYCDRMSIDNFVFDTSPYPGYTIKLYTYYDLLIAFEENLIISPPVVNFTQKWSIRLDEPIDISLFNMIPIGSIIYNPSSESNYGCCGSCSGNEYLLKIGTENHIYYVNATNGLVLYKLNMRNTKNLKSPFIFNNPRKNEETQQSVSDTNYNGSLYLTSILVNASLSKCNIGKRFWDCQKNTILNIQTQEVKIEMPPEKPRCGTALEMFCPHNNLGREDCLNCIIKNRENLNMCSVSSEENWCDSNILISEF